MRDTRGITLIALIITIIVLLILAGVAISLTIGEDGIFKKSEQSAGVYNKEEATEKMNMKITYSQMHTYTQKQRMPTLQELADDLCEDKEIEYVQLESKQIAKLDKIVVGENKSIFTKIRAYPYEFEINSSLQLASIDGVRIDTNETITISKEEYEQLKSDVEELKNIIKDANVQYQKLRSDDYEEVAFVSGTEYIAPCDGYYCFVGFNNGNTTQYSVWVEHYTADGIYVSHTTTPSYNWGYTGSEMYVKKGEKLKFGKDSKISIISSKFFYAQGSKPNEKEEN